MDLPFSTEDLTRLYRFALLLTGSEEKAHQVMNDACAECGARLGSFRNEDGRMACIIGTLRRLARSAGAGEGSSEAKAFATLPEEERAALAALYTGLLPARGLAEAMKLTLEQLGRLLKSARTRLEAASVGKADPASLERAL